MNLRKIYYFLSPKLRLVVRRLFYFPIDLLNIFRLNKTQLSPPKGKIFTGSGDFLKQGETFLNHFIDLGNLMPEHNVLDIGSGIGRMAIPLTKYLSQEGKYEGFDIVKTGVKWCQKNITPKFPNFNFTHLNLKNSLYNLSTNQEASKIKFPYQDNSFDLIILTSVFTHMLPDDVENYLQEISRVLKSSGKCFCTFFILSKELKNTNSSFNFAFNKGNYSLMDEKVPEANVAYKNDYLNTIISNAGLKVKSEHFGYWSGKQKSESLSFQDVLILEKQ
ncbi:MAG: methyltransferase domain-containing protein [Bacteroidales bacterium]|nr:methyltransferase domain-containing protein [Bacteroidales bacterium]